MHFPLNNQMGNAFLFFYGLFMYGSKGYLLVLFYVECFHSKIYSTCAQFFFDTEKAGYILQHVRICLVHLS